MAEIKSYPNNANVEIGAENVMRWHHGRTRGVYGASGELAVAPLTTPGMAVTVSDGSGWMTDASGNGIHFWNDTFAVTAALLQISIDTADGVLNRIDRVIVEWSTPNYTQLPEIKVLKGTNAVTPVAPTLTNNASLRQISLSRISVSAGTLAITAGMITDERIDPTVCGIVTETTEVDTSVAVAQLNAVIAQAQALVNAITGEYMPDHAETHALVGDDPIPPASIGALPYDVNPSSLLNNENFDFWQKGTSFSNPVSNAITADRWQLTYNGSGSTRAVSRQAFTVGQSDVPRNPVYFLRVAETVAASGETAKYLRQGIEDVRRLAGQDITISFYAKAAANTTISVQPVQNFGSGGSSVVGVTAQSIALTTAWARFELTFTIPSISGKTIGTSSYLDIRFNLPLNATYTVDVASVQVNRGAAALPYISKAYSEAYSECLRYQYIPTLSHIVARAVGIDANNLYFYIPTAVPMRTNPTFLGTIAVDYLIRNLSGVGQTGFTFSATVVGGGIYVAATKNAHGLTDGQFVITTSSGFDANL